VQTSYTYEPFGKVTQSGTSSANTFKYTGREQDASGLTYLRARYYSPSLQRFLSEDPIGLSGGDANLYAYVSSSPLAHTDRSGEVAPEVAACVGGALFNLVTERLSGRKFTTSDAISGCAAGLAGFGLGKALGRLLPAARGASPALRKQIDEVGDSIISTGKPPIGVRQGGLPGKPGVYGNKGGQLPARPEGYYTESDVWAGTGPRGAERLIVGKRGEVWYTPDHYKTFRRIR
jgi:RHS repeat-associated protein